MRAFFARRSASVTAATAMPPVATTAATWPWAAHGGFCTRTPLLRIPPFAQYLRDTADAYSHMSNETARLRRIKADYDALSPEAREELAARAATSRARGHDLSRRLAIRGELASAGRRTTSSNTMRLVKKSSDAVREDAARTCDHDEPAAVTDAGSVATAVDSVTPKKKAARKPKSAKAAAPTADSTAPAVDAAPAASDAPAKKAAKPRRAAAAPGEKKTKPPRRGVSSEPLSTLWGGVPTGTGAPPRETRVP